MKEVKQFVQLLDEDNRSTPEVDEQADGSAAAAILPEEPQWTYKLHVITFLLSFKHVK